MTFYYFNDDKTACVFMPAKSSFYINTPAVFLNGRGLSFTVKYKYLITNDGSDEANMSRQRSVFFMRAAMVYPIISTLRNEREKATLFRTFCSIVGFFGMILGSPL